MISKKNKVKSNLLQPKTLYSVLLAYSVFPLVAYADEGDGLQILQDVIVEASQPSEFIEPKTTQSNTETTLTRQKVQQIAGPAQVNPVKALDLIPSVNGQNADPYGMAANQPPSNQAVRIRGESASSSGTPGSIRTIEGIPLTGAPGGGASILDLENSDGLTIYRGAIPPNRGLGWANIAGNLDIAMLKPAEKFGLFAKQSYGSFDFNRTFARIDSGRLATDTQLFGSFSYTTAEKWRGEGDAPDYRNNAEFGIAQKFSDQVKLEIYGFHNNFAQDDYRPLNDSQATNLSQFNEFDFNPRLTGNPAQDIYYYGFNNQQFEDNSLFTHLEIRPTANSRVSIKPYYWHDQGYYLLGVPAILGQPGVRRWDIDHEQYGVITEYEQRMSGLPLFDESRFTLGYWYQSQQPPGPPSSWKAYQVTSSGDLKFTGWALLNQQSDHVFHSPYALFNGRLGNFRMDVGGRYIHQEIAAITSYQTQNLPDVSYDEVFGFNPKIDPGASVGSRSINEFLPYLGLNYSVADNTQVYLAYGKTIGAGKVNQYPNYMQSRSAFERVGVTLQQIWDTLEPEIADKFDLGLRISDCHWYIAPTFYYSKSENKPVNAFDPQVGVSYLQNADATGYGAELEFGMDANSQLSLFTALSYNIFEFDGDIRTAANTVISTSGKQIPDAPELMAKLGIVYRPTSQFSISPVVRYVSSRYGDALNTVRIPSYTVADLSINYREHAVPKVGDVSFGLDFLNLFDTQYIAIISATDDQRPGTTSYYPGAPFAVVGTISLKF